MEILPRPVRAVLQRALRVPPVRALGHVAYRVSARLAAARLARVPHVRTVLLTGSMTRPGAVEPGYSDIDFILGVEVPTLEDELRFRHALAKELRLLSLFVPLNSLDYFPVDDIVFLRRHSDAWTLDLDRRWKVMAGEPLGGEPVDRGPTERRLLLVSADMRRWVKGCASVFDSRSPVAAYGRRRVARRVLTDVLSGWLGHDRHAGLPVLLDAMRSHPGNTPEIHDLVAMAHEAEGLDHREICLRLVSTALAVIDASTREFAEGWEGSFEVEGRVPPLPDSGPIHDFVHAALEEPAVAACYSVPGRSSTRPDFVACVMHEGVPAREGAETFERLLLLGARLDIYTRPVLLTPSMFRAAAALDPTPMLGASLTAPEAFAGGVALPPPPEPPREQLDLFIRQRLGRYLYQMQGRAFRIQTDDDTARLAMWTDLEVSRQLIESLKSGRIPIESPEPPERLPSQDELAALVREARPRIRAALERD